MGSPTQAEVRRRKAIKTTASITLVTVILTLTGFVLATFGDSALVCTTPVR